MNIEQINRLDSSDYCFLREHLLNKASGLINRASQSISPEILIKNFAEITSFLEKARFVADQEKNLIDERLRLEQEERAAFEEWRKNSEPKKPV